MDVADLSLAAWSVVHAGTQQIVAGGPLPGLLQSVPRAELTAVLVAMKWTLLVKQPTVTWSDAKNVVQGVWALQEGSSLAPSMAHHDLWEQLASCVQQLSSEDCLVKHVPIHRNPDLCEGPVEDWICTWNNCADLVAGIFNRNRPQEFVDCHGQAAGTSRSLRSMYGAIGEYDQGRPTVGGRREADEDVAEELPIATGRFRAHRFQDDVPMAWNMIVQEECAKFPTDFVQQVMQFLLT